MLECRESGQVAKSAMQFEFLCLDFLQGSPGGKLMLCLCMLPTG